jgi:hypothetical protein
VLIPGSSSELARRPAMKKLFDRFDSQSEIKLQEALIPAW